MIAHTGSGQGSVRLQSPLQPHTKPEDTGLSAFLCSLRLPSPALLQINLFCYGPSLPQCFSGALARALPSLSLRWPPCLQFPHWPILFTLRCPSQHINPGIRAMGPGQGHPRFHPYTQLFSSGFNHTQPPIILLTNRSGPIPPLALCTC